MHLSDGLDSNNTRNDGCQLPYPEGGVFRRGIMGRDALPSDANGQAPLVFALNGRRMEIRDVDPAMTLNEFVRTRTEFTGTKLACGEGGCGACAVMVARYNPLTSTIDERSLNSCLLPLASLHVAAITTAEGLCSASRSSPADLPAANGGAGAPAPSGAANGAGKDAGLKQQRDPHTCHKGGRAEQPHAVQQRLAGFHASQCGFCTPGMSIALYAALRRRRAGASGEGVEAVSGLTEQEVEEAMAGNLCRCTGYRPILDACKSFAGANGSAATSGAAAAAEAAGGLMDLEELGSVGAAGMRSCTVLDISEFAPAAASSAQSAQCGGKQQGDGSGSTGGGDGGGKCSKSGSGKCSGLCGTPRKPLPRYDPASDPSFPAWLTVETQRQLSAQQKQTAGEDKMLGWEVWEESGAGEAAGVGGAGANGEVSAAGEEEAGEQAEEVKVERKGRKVAWVAPRSLEELQSVLLGGKGEGGAGDGGEVRLVVGNTAVGVYPELGRYDGVARVTRVDLKRLPELQHVAWEEGPGGEESEGGEAGARVMGIRFGAAVCLADVIAVLDTVAGKGTGASTSSSSSTSDGAPVITCWDEATAAGASSAAAAAEVFSSVAAHLRKVAGPHVRNAASIGGNLVLAASQRAFPSDVTTLLLALNASVRTATPTLPTAASGAEGGAGEGAGGSEGWAWEEVSLEQFLLRGPLPCTTLLHSVFLPCPSLSPSAASAGQQLVFDSFRASVRPSGNAYAYVNAAFLLHLSPASSSSSSSPIIHSARLVFGAFGRPHAIRARQAESCLLSAAANGALTPDSMLEAVRAVRGEVVPPEGTRWAEYRAEAAVGFLFSFLSRHLPQIDPPQKSLQDGGAAAAGAAAAGAAAAEAAASVAATSGAAGDSVSGDRVRSSSEQQHVVMRGQQVYSVTNDVFPLALPLPKLGVDLQATGHAIFVDDIPVPSSCLYAAFAVSTHASARITSRCYAAALTSPGVVAVLDASHLPPGGANVGSNLMGSVDPLFAEGRSEYYGQPLALVVADSYRHAQEGARKVVCTYDSSLPPAAAAHKPEAERPAAGPTAAAATVAESGSPAGEASGAILTIEQAEAAGSYFPLNPMFAMALPRRGNFQEAFDKSPLKISGAEVRSGSQQHFYMEPQVAMAVPDEGGTLTVYSATQSPQFTQESVAAALGLPVSCVRVVTRRLGGGFGGKACQSNWVAVACALAAQHLHRPVRMALERKADTALVGGRHEARVRYDVGYDVTGRVHALRVSTVLNAGCTETMSNWLPMNYGAAITQYDWGALQIDLKIAKTNLPTRVTVRAPGEVQGVLVAETVMDHVAFSLNLDPVLVRECNHITTDSLRAFFPRGFPPAAPASPPAAAAAAAAEEKAEDEGAIAERVWREVKALASYSKRVDAVQEFNATHKWRKRGLAIAPVHYMVPIMGKPARVTVFGDASVVVETGGVEMGQGLFTKVRQAAANSLNQLWLSSSSSSSGGSGSSGRPMYGYGVDVSCIRVVENDSISMGNAGMTAASSTSEASCAAIQLACDQLLPLLQAAKAASEKAKACKRLGVAGGGPGGMFGGGGAAAGVDVVVGEEDVASWEEVVRQAKAMRMYLSAQANYQPKPPAGSFFLSYFNFGAAVSEVEVDVVTGSVSVVRCDIHYDCGRSLNPAVDIGQVEGAFVQGQGFFTTEEVVVDEASGRLLTDGTWSYKVPSFDTTPRQLNVSLLQGAGNDRGVLSSKTSGEPPLLLAVSIHSAIRYAIAAARREFADPQTPGATGSDEFVRLDSPATMAVVQQACGSHLVEAYLEKQLMASPAAVSAAAAAGGGTEVRPHLVSRDFMLGVFGRIQKILLCFLTDRKLKKRKSTPKWNVKDIMSCLTLLQTARWDLPFPSMFQSLINGLVHLSESFEQQALRLMRVQDLLLELYKFAEELEIPVINECNANVLEFAVLQRALFGEHAGHHLFDCVWAAHEPPDIVFCCFQVALKLVQASLFDISVHPCQRFLSIWRLLEEAYNLDAAEWLACMKTTLQGLLSSAAHGEDLRRKQVLLFLANADLADTILFCLVKVVECGAYQAKDGYSQALGLFEKIFEAKPSIVFTSCSAVLANEQLEAIQLRLECLSCLERLGQQDEAANILMWTPEVRAHLTHAMLFDPSTRVRRAAVQILSASPNVDQEFLTSIAIKTRDVDKKVRLAAFTSLRDAPMELLIASITPKEWETVLRCGLCDNEPSSELSVAAKELLFKYLTCDDISGLPSARLNMLQGFMENFDEIKDALEDRIEDIFEKELAQVESAEVDMDRDDMEKDGMEHEESVIFEGRL
ncbi:unnamed protein product [Closterium sp. NIES-53]